MYSYTYMYIVTGISVVLLFIRHIGEHYNNIGNTNKISKRIQKQKKEKKNNKTHSIKIIRKKAPTTNFQPERWPLQ